MRGIFKIKCIYLLFILISGFIFLIACGQNNTTVKCWDEQSEQRQNIQYARKDTINASIYLDATESMKGFAKAHGIYRRFLTDLEAVVSNGWPKTKITFYNFGDNVYKIKRDDFLRGRYPSFYNARHGFLHTKIDNVIKELGKNDLSIIITDLFQDQGDINVIASSIKTNCFLHGIDFALIAIPSQFDGIVYDVPNGRGGATHYYYRSDPDDFSTFKPFYIFVFGRESNILEFIRILKARCNNILNNDNILIFNEKIVKKSEATNFEHAKNIFQPLRHSELPNTRTLKFKQRKRGEIKVSLKIDKNPYALDFDPSKLKLILYYKKITENDGLAKRVDLNAYDIESNNGNLNVSFELEPPQEEGKYCYKLHIIVPYEALQVKKYFLQWDTKNPSAKLDPNKTLGLEEFIKSVSQGYLASHDLPVIGKVYLNITVR